MRELPRSDGAEFVQVTGATWDLLADLVESAYGMTVGPGLDKQASRHGSALALKGASGSGPGVYVRAPAGGIPAATWDGTNQRLAPGFADCVVLQWDATIVLSGEVDPSGSYVPIADTVAVGNPFLDAIPAESIVEAVKKPEGLRVAAAGCTTIS